MYCDFVNEYLTNGVRKFFKICFDCELLSQLWKHLVFTIHTFTQSVKSWCVFFNMNLVFADDWIKWKGNTYSKMLYMLYLQRYFRWIQCICLVRENVFFVSKFLSLPLLIRKWSAVYIFAVLCSALCFLQKPKTAISLV